MSCYTNTLEDTVEELERELSVARTALGECLERNRMLREVFEAARKKVGLREGCTYDQVIERLEAL